MFPFSSPLIPKDWPLQSEAWQEKSILGPAPCKRTAFNLSMDVSGEEWSAPEYKVTGNLLIQLTPADFRDKSLPKIILTLFRSLKDDADWSAQLTPTTLLLGWDTNPQKLLRLIGEKIGFTAFSILVLDIADQSGFGWDCQSGSMLKIGAEIPDPEEMASLQEKESLSEEN